MNVSCIKFQFEVFFNRRGNLGFPWYSALGILNWRLTDLDDAHSKLGLMPSGVLVIEC